MNDKYDDSFEDYPAGGNALKDVLTAADRELEPGTATDAAILAAARRSVGARPEALGWTVRHPLVRPLATAALLVLSVGVVTLLVEQDQTAPSLPRPAGPVDRMEPPAMDTARKAEDDGVGAVAPVLKAPAPMVFEHAAPPAMMDDDREKQDVDGHVDEAAAAAPVGSDAAFEALSDDAVPGPGKRDLRPERARRVDQAPTGAARQAEPESVPAFSRTLPAPAADSAPVPGSSAPALQSAPMYQAAPELQQAPVALEPGERVAEDSIAGELADIVALCRQRRPYQAVLERFRLRYPEVDEARLQRELGDCYLPRGR